MWALLTPRFWIGLALVAALAFTHGFAYKTGRAAVRTAWDKERAETTAAALVASEAARAKEKVLSVANAKVTNDYQAEKRRRAADAVVSNGRLRDLQAALSSASGTDTATVSGADDPRSRIIDECASALVSLDGYAKGVALTAIGLQGYASSVCMTK